MRISISVRPISPSKSFRFHCLKIGGLDDFKEPVGFKKMGLTFTAEFFGGKLQLKFIYAKSFFYDYFRIGWVLIDIIKSRPYAIMFNTGIWDYDNIARAHR